MSLNPLQAVTPEMSYTAISEKYENSLTEKYKKANGVFYTDYSLADTVFGSIKRHLTPDSVILDPCCGAGVFLAVAAKHGFKNSYGTDVDNGAIALCTEYIHEANFKTHDFLGSEPVTTLNLLELSWNVDCIVGNPPYVPLSGDVSLRGDDSFRRQVSAMGNNLFVAAILRALSLLKECGILSYIIPKNFLHVSSYSKLREFLLKNYTILSISDIGSHFKGVRGEQIVLTVQNTKPVENESEIALCDYRDGGFQPMCLVNQSFYTDEILLFDCEKDKKVYELLTGNFKTLSVRTEGYVGRGKSDASEAIAGNDIRKFGYKSKPTPPCGSQIFIQNIYSAESGVIAAFGGELEASQTVTVFTDGNPRMCRFILGILHSRLCNFFLYRYCFNRSRLTMHTDAKYLKKIPLPACDAGCPDFDRIHSLVEALEQDKYLSASWFDNYERLNTAVYEVYGIAPNLKDYIDSAVLASQSKKWRGIE